MFCPQCSHQQTFDQTRFCSRCGLPLGIVTDLLGNSSDQLQREKREMTGIGLMIATVLMLLNFLFIVGLVTLPHLANPVFLWIWILFVLSAAIVSGLGLVNLIRSGFFKRLKERETRLRLMKSQRQLLEETKKASHDIEAIPLAEGTSVTETTTRQLDAMLLTRGNASDRKTS